MISGKILLSSPHFSMRETSQNQLFCENAGLAWDFHPRVEGKRLPMDLFCENAELARIFIPGWRAKRCPWIMPPIGVTAIFHRLSRRLVI
ncbi:hypothetical protein MKY25_12815 [Geobacillus sp. FSL W8-0032]|uniref:hypothetical protein n=1 Tax=Geobacillus TaxID=129337 RepID=UPI00103F77B2|nr:hypothetical protein [Geobacillus icigianus]